MRERVRTSARIRAPRITVTDSRLIGAWIRAIPRAQGQAPRAGDRCTIGCRRRFDYEMRVTRAAAEGGKEGAKHIKT